ncbi:MAG: hypothetical protein IPK96_05685 [Flammeovirgaceae bacterium]|nr:hypothetical protein [Flammeovirgaceae bacterium]
MNRILLSALVTLIVTSCNNSEKIKVSDQAILIHNANIINVTDGSILENKAILMDSGTIQSIGDYATLKSLVDPKKSD